MFSKGLPETHFHPAPVADLGGILAVLTELDGVHGEGRP